jgi:hypothetical protein
VQIGVPLQQLKEMEELFLYLLYHGIICVQNNKVLIAFSFD